MNSFVVLTHCKMIKDPVAKKAFDHLKIPLEGPPRRISLTAFEAPLGVDFDPTPYRSHLFEIAEQIGLDFNIVKRRKYGLFVADMDSTIIAQECLDELADMKGLGDAVSQITEAAMQGALDFETALRSRVSLLRTIPESTLDECYTQRISLNEGADSLIAGLRTHGVITVLVSGGFSFFANQIAHKLQFDHAYSNRFEIIDKSLTGDLAGPIIDKNAKARILRQHRAALGKKPVIAIGDGANDIEMIKEADLGIAFHAKPALREIADIRLDHSNLSALLDILAIQ